MKTVLIADDDINMVQILSHILSELHLNIVTENNGKAALETAIEIRPDLLILDFIMPIMDGLSVLKELYSAEIGFKSPSILLTAHDPLQYQHQAEAMGNVRFVEKPFEIAPLLSLVSELLK